jgi:hypothetical protein
MLSDRKPSLNVKCYEILDTKRTAKYRLHVTPNLNRIFFFKDRQADGKGLLAETARYIYKRRFSSMRLLLAMQSFTDIPWNEFPWRVNLGIFCDKNASIFLTLSECPTKY